MPWLTNASYDLDATDFGIALSIYKEVPCCRIFARSLTTFISR